MKNLAIASVLCILIASHFDARSQGLANSIYGKLWAAEGTLSGLQCAHTDASGNIYLAGSSKLGGNYGDIFAQGGSAIASPTSGTVFHYILKYNANGTLNSSTFLYSNSSLVTFEINIRGIVTDNSGNVYVTGFFDGTVDFDGGGGTTNLSSSAGSSFLAKYNSSLGLTWAKNFGSPNAVNKAVPEDVTVSPATGNVWITGYFIGAASNGTLPDMDPGAGTANLLGISTSRGGFVSAYNPSTGAYASSSVGVYTNNSIAVSGAPSGADDVRPVAIAVSSSGKIFIAGYFENNMLSGGTCSGITGSGFVSSFDPGNGNCNLISVSGSSSIINDMEIDASNNIYVAGETGTEGVVIKYNSSLTQQWIRFGGRALYSMDTDATNNVYVAGYKNSFGGYIQKYNSSGAAQFDGTSGFALPDSPAFRAVQVSGSNILLGGTWGFGQGFTIDIGFDDELLEVSTPPSTTSQQHQHWGVYYHDNVGPVGTVTTTASNPTNVSPIPITVTFNEPVSGFVAGDHMIENANVSNPQTLNNKTYTFDLTPTLSQGQIEYQVFTGMFDDLHNNLNEGSNTFTIAFDAVAPTATVTSTSPNSTGVTPIPVTITFSETVSGFSMGDIGVTNGTAGNFVAVSGTVYTADISPTTSGTVIVSVSANAALDAAGNNNTAATPLTRTYTGGDTTPPTVTLTSTSSDPTNISPIPVTFTFNETVTGFVVGDITVMNGSAGSFNAVSGTVYTANITPGGQGTVTISVGSNVAIDGAANNNLASSNFTRVFDSAAPTVTISSTSSDPTNISPIPVTFTFNETVTGFVVGDITVMNGSAGSFNAVSGTVYTANITPGGQGTVTISVGSNVAIDGAANNNLASSNFTRVFDNAAPTVTISSTSSDPTNLSAVPVTFTFNETVTGFVVGDITVVNGSAGSFNAVSGTVYTANITPGGQGTVTISVGANKAIDGAANNNLASSNFTRVFDNAAPTVTISSTSSDPTNISPIPVTFTFNETVSGFVVGDITVVNGTAGSFNPVSGTVYTANITPAGQGTVTISVGANKATDGAGNSNVASTNFTRVFDSAAPTVTISSTSSDPTNISPIPVTFTFNETVTGFVVGDITVVNGSAGSFNAVSGTVYTAIITPAGQGTVTISVGANKATDGAGNSNVASTNFTRVFDNAAPTVTISSTSSDPTNISPIPVTFTFNETVSGFVVGDITVVNGTAGSFNAVSGTVYTANITPAGQGTVTISVGANKTIDGAGNNNAASTNFTRVFDSTAPTVTITSTSSDPTNASPFPVTFTFSESVTGFVVGDITVLNGTAGSFDAVSGTVYTANITPGGQGTVTISIAANVALGSSGNSNSGSSTFTRVFDNVAPTITITSTSSDPTNDSPIPVTFTFNEVVTGFVVGDITVVNGSAGSFNAVSGTVYNANITPSGQGTVTVSVGANKVIDGAGNNNLASSNFTRLFDNTAPTVTITSAVLDPTNISSIPVTFTFNEAVTGFVLGDITVVNGAAGSFNAVSGTVYTTNITPGGQGTVTVSVAANKAIDDAGNNNVASSNFTRFFDSTAPAVNITSVSPDPTDISPIHVTFTFSETITGFSNGDIQITNGTAENFVSLSGAIYTADISVATPGPVTVSVGANVTTDAAGNGNVAASPLSRNYTGTDTTPPSVTISSTSSDPTNVSPIPVTFTFNETVTGFVVGDITVVNGSAGSFNAVSGTVYTANITPGGQGTVTISVGANVAIDGSGNNNLASSNFTRVFDNAAPSVTISSTSSDPTNASPIPVTFTFSEPVTGFVVGDITVVNGSAGSFNALSGTVYTANITPVGQGTVTISVGSDVAIDGTGNNNLASSNFTRLFDNAAPTVNITSTSSDPTSTSPIPIAFTFNEAVTGFGLTDITVLNGTAGSFNALSNVLYTCAITPSAAEVVRISVGASVAVDQAGNGNSASSFEITFEKTNQAISFNPLTGKTLGDAPFSLTATASSTLAVSFSTSSDKISISGTTVTLVKAGMATVKADQSGNAQYNSAPTVQNSFCINPAKPAISLSNDNSPNPVLTSNSSQGNQWFKDGALLSSAVGQTLSVSDPGSYSVQVTVEGCVSAKSDNIAMIITGLEQSDADLVRIYPNPAIDRVVIIIPGGRGGTIRITNLQGQRVLEHQSTAKEEEIDVTVFPAGVFLVLVETTRGSYQSKLIKQ